MSRVAGEAVDVQLQLGGVAEQVLVIELRVLLEQQIVHLPEGTLRAGRLGRLGRVLGMRVQLGDREVPEREPHVLGVPVDELAHVARRRPAERALVVAVLDDLDARRRRPAHVVSLGQDDELLSHFQVLPSSVVHHVAPCACSWILAAAAGAPSADGRQAGMMGA